MAQFKDVIQFLSGQHKGLIAQVMAVDAEGVHCYQRGFGGETHFFIVPDKDFVVLGMARMGPRPDSQPPVALPPPIKPDDVLIPVPPEAKIVPLNEPEPPPQIILKEPELPPPPPVKRKRGRPFKSPPPPTP